jgi:hypothetical protein
MEEMMTDNPKQPQVPMTTGVPLPADLTDLTTPDAGKGVSTKAEDAIVPLITVLQNGSPQCDKRGPEYIDGAEPGKFWLRGAVDPIRDEIIAIPCAMAHTWMEWLPDRQGFAARHEEEPSDVEVKPAGGTSKRPILVRPNGNVVENVREVYVLVDGQPYMLPCASTFHQFAREWQSYFRQWQHPTTHKVLPSFARRYKLVTVPKTNPKGKWFMPKFVDLGWVDKTEYANARAFHEFVEQGRQRIAPPDRTDDAA